MTSILNGINGQTATIEDVITLIGNIRNLALGFVGALCVLMIIWGGVQYLTSFGNDEKAAAGKKTLTWAIVGLIIVILAATIIQIVLNILGTGQHAT